LKEQSKRDGLLAISQGYKILLNAFYGKNCARVDYQSSFYFKTEDYEQLKNDGVKTMRIGNKIHSLDTFRVREYATIEDNESINSDFSSVGYKIIKTTNIEKNYKDVNNVLIGGTIASYGRVQLQDAVYRIGWKNFIYCDTDSIYSTLTIKQVSKLLNMDDYKLGM
jgi:C-terminal processing protease CtpA/Prc